MRSEEQLTGVKDLQWTSLARAMEQEIAIRAGDARTRVEVIILLIVCIIASS